MPLNKETKLNPNSTTWDQTRETFFLFFKKWQCVSSTKISSSASLSRWGMELFKLPWYVFGRLDIYLIIVYIYFCMRFDMYVIIIPIHQYI